MTVVLPAEKGSSELRASAESTQEPCRRLRPCLASLTEEEKPPLTASSGPGNLEFAPVTQQKILSLFVHLLPTEGSKVGLTNPSL